jgi:NAD(P)-dependent dehydrogenase (short-subunit alcohol dehydrogenase family)
MAQDTPGRRFEDRVVLVMGGGSVAGPGMGNGRATALAFAREGARVVVVDLAPERALETVALIAAEQGQAEALSADVTREADVRAVVEHTVSAHGRIDVLHNNVGVSGGATGDVESTAEAAWDREVGVSAKSVFVCCKLVLPIMVKQGSGVITNTSSTLARRFIEIPSFGYSAAKAAVESMTRSIAVSHGPRGIRANCIRIGFMDTPLNRSGWSPALGGDAGYQRAIAASARAVPLRRMGTAQDTAAAALFLASDEGGYLNGVVLPVDGGVEHAPVHIEGLLGDRL